MANQVIHQSELDGPPGNTSNLKALYSYGLAYLTGREASQKRLFQKLLASGYGQPEEVKMTLDRLMREGWVSDRRFAESYTHYRSERGFGPKYIEYALRQEGLSLMLIQEVFLEMNIDWQELIEKLVSRKFPNLLKINQSMILRAKAERFLLSRGFEWSHIRKAFK